MKNVLSTIVIVLISISSYAQTEGANKKLEFGFNLGVNRANIILKNESLLSPKINNKTGVELGVLMSYNPTRWLSILPQAELSFNSASLQYNWTDMNGVPLGASQDELYPVSLGFKTHLHFILDNEKNSPYLIVGPSLRIDIENEDNMTSTSFKSRPNVALDFGVGFDSKLKHFKFSPEVVYSYGLVNVNPLLEDTYYHKLSLILNFKD